MTWNWKLFLPIGIVVVILVVVLFVWLETKVPQIAVEKTPSPLAEKLEVLPPATGNVNDAVNAILIAVDNELPILDDYDNDAFLVTVDSQEVSDFGQAYDETAF